MQPGSISDSPSRESYPLSPMEFPSLKRSSGQLDVRTHFTEVDTLTASLGEITLGSARLRRATGQLGASTSLRYAFSSSDSAGSDDTAPTSVPPSYRTIDLAALPDASKRTPVSFDDYAATSYRYCDSPDSIDAIEERELASHSMHGIIESARAAAYAASPDCFDGETMERIFATHYSRLTVLLLADLEAALSSFEFTDNDLLPVAEAMRLVDASELQELNDQRTDAQFEWVTPSLAGKIGIAYRTIMTHQRSSSRPNVKIWQGIETFLSRTRDKSAAEYFKAIDAKFKELLTLRLQTPRQVEQHRQFIDIAVTRLMRREGAGYNTSQCVSAQRDLLRPILREVVTAKLMDAIGDREYSLQGPKVTTDIYNLLHRLRSHGIADDDSLAPLFEWESSLRSIRELWRAVNISDHRQAPAYR